MVGVSSYAGDAFPFGAPDITFLVNVLNIVCQIQGFDLCRSCDLYVCVFIDTKNVVDKDLKQHVYLTIMS